MPTFSGPLVHVQKGLYVSFQKFQFFYRIMRFESTVMESVMLIACSQARKVLAMKFRNDETNFLPAGWHSVTPRIVAHQAEQLVEFLKHVFNATGDYRTDRPAILTIGDSMLMISDAGMRDPTPAFLYVYVANADITYQRALETGARSLEEPSDTPYGDRRGMVEDPWGNTWQIATCKRDEST